jgi:hypothetical protein
VICADLKRLVPAHDQACFPVLPVLEQPHIARSALFPLARLPNKLEKLSPHFEDLLLGLLVRLDLDLLGQVNYGLEVNVLGLGRFVRLQQRLVSELRQIAGSKEQGERTSSPSFEPLAAAASRCAFALPELSPRSSSSSFLSFLAPPPNMENTADCVTGFSASCILMSARSWPSLRLGHQIIYRCWRSSALGLGLCGRHVESGPEAVSGGSNELGSRSNVSEQLTDGMS